MARPEREIHRVHLLQPLRGTVGEHRIFVMDVSLRGFRIAHQDRLGADGDRLRIEFEYDGQPVRARCHIRWTASQQVGKASYSRSLYHSGLQIREIAQPSRKALVAMIESHVMRALDEQRSNAHGVPPGAPPALQRFEIREYVRHEHGFVGWREAKTDNPAQPHHGFTIASDATSEEVAMLRATYEGGDLQTRDMIRKLAAASVSVSNGVRMRRYQP
jgi:hypothetical protein